MGPDDPISNVNILWIAQGLRWTNELQRNYKTHLNSSEDALVSTALYGRTLPKNPHVHVTKALTVLVPWILLFFRAKNHQKDFNLLSSRCLCEYQVRLRGEKTSHKTPSCVSPVTLIYKWGGKKHPTWYFRTWTTVKSIFRAGFLAKRKWYLINWS